MLLPDDHLCDQIADALAGPGYLILDSAIPQSIEQGLLSAFPQDMKQAGVGRGKDFHQDQQVRGDQIRWLTQDQPAEAAFLNWMSALQQGLNQRLYMGLQEYESHFAHYPPGAFYQKHLDAFKGKPGRKLSTVFYLNSDWPQDAAGELVIYDGASDKILDVAAPECGRLVIFLSENFPHEVKPARLDRRSIAGWFKIQPAPFGNNET
jgi:SM-20-related protein